MRHLLARFCLILLAVAAAGCGASQTAPQVAAEPTIAPIFSSPPTARPTVRPTARPTDIPPRPTPTLAAASPDNTATYEIPIYIDGLEDGWSLTKSDGVTYTTRVAEYTYSGSSAVKAQPTKGFGQLVFGVTDEAPVPFRRRDVLGVRFRISGNEAVIPNDAIIVTVFGSKKFPYYVPGDISATRPPGRVTWEEPLFPETRLYFLDINRAIKAGEWAEVVVWLDEHFTPDYTYVTGLQIKNDESYLDPFYVDDVALILSDS